MKKYEGLEMKSSMFGIIVLMAILLALSFGVSFAEDACTDLRACVENCSQIQNCTMFISCIENCTLNTTSGLGEARGNLHWRNDEKIWNPEGQVQVPASSNPLIELREFK